MTNEEIKERIVEVVSLGILYLLRLFGRRILDKLTDIYENKKKKLNEKDPEIRKPKVSKVVNWIKDIFKSKSKKSKESRPD